MPSIKRKFGDTGERFAEEFLLKRGYKLLDRNYRIKNIGEIDLVAEKNNRLTFFEVKTRNAHHAATFPIELSINEKKRRNLKKICQLYLLHKDNYEKREWQVDAILINVDFDTNLRQIDHLENILWEEYY